MAMIQKKSNGDTLEDVSIISKGVNIEGKLNSEGNVRIDGIIRGDVLVSGNLTLGETSEITGEVKAENITLSGKVIGTVTANEKIVLEGKGVLKGDLIAKVLVVEPGGLFDGKCTMTKEPKTQFKEVNL
jgi:cytoskeletal protein CcmA (bactofilin family)